MNAQDISDDKSDKIRMENGIAEFLFDQEKCSNLPRTPLVGHKVNGREPRIEPRKLEYWNFIWEFS